MRSDTFVAGPDLSHPGADALIWAAAFAASSSSLSQPAIALLVLHPAIDVAASLAVARSHDGAGVSRLQIVNATLSVVAVIAVAITAANDTSAVLRAFGTWAWFRGWSQLSVAVSRRSRVGWKWAMLISGIGSTGAGLMFVAMGRERTPIAAQPGRLRDRRCGAVPGVGPVSRAYDRIPSTA